MPTARKLPSLVVLAAVGTLGVAAAPAHAAPSTAQFAKRADAICRPLSAKLKALPEPTDAAGVVPYFQQSLAAARPAVKALRALELPSAKRTQARRAVSGAAQEVTVLRDAVKALEGGANPTTTLKRFVRRLDRVEKAEDRDWRAVGATDCAK